MSVTFSDSLIKEYQDEMYSTYGVLVNETDAQTQLRTLVRSIFTSVIAEQRTGSREQGAMRGLPACAGSLSVKLDDDGEEVGASITPTSGHTKTKSHG